MFMAADFPSFTSNESSKNTIMLSSLANYSQRKLIGKS